MKSPRRSTPILVSAVLGSCTVAAPENDALSFDVGTGSTSGGAASTGHGSTGTPEDLPPPPLPDDFAPPPPPVCGDGVPGPGEACDDGNLVNGDGCEADCSLPACGNGIVDPGEWCYALELVPMPAAPGPVTIGDLDDDGRDEVLVPLSEVNVIATIGLMPGLPDPHVELVLAGKAPRRIALADTAQDGRPEPFVLGDDGILRLENVSGIPGPGTLVASCPDATAFVPRQVDLDGRVDLLVSRPTTLAVAGLPPWIGMAIHSLIAQPDGTYVSEAFEQLDGTARDLFPAVADDDVLPDLYVLESDPGGIAVLVGSKTGHLDTAFTKHVVSPGAATVLDVSGDGYSDVALGLEGVDALFLLEADGAGQFQPAKQFQIGGPVRALVAHDLDGDDDDDVVAVTDFPELVVLEGHGQSQLTTATSLALPAPGHALASGDVNGDGLPDLAVSFPELDAVGLILANP